MIKEGRELQAKIYGACPPQLFVVQTSTSLHRQVSKLRTGQHLESVCPQPHPKNTLCCDPMRYVRCSPMRSNAVIRQIVLNPLMSTLKPQSNGPLYNNMMIGTLTVDGWTVIFGTARRLLGGLRPRPVLSSLYQM